MIFNMVGGGGGIEGCVKGTATHTYSGGMKLTGLIAPPKMVAIWKWYIGDSNCYGDIMIMAGWDGSKYTYRYGADFDKYGTSSGSACEFIGSATYTDGTLNIKTGVTRFNGQAWNYMYVY